MISKLSVLHPLSESAIQQSMIDSFLIRFAPQVTAYLPTSAPELNSTGCRKNIPPILIISTTLTLFYVSFK